MLYLYGVSQFVFSCDDDSKSYYSVVDASLTRGTMNDSGNIGYTLKLVGEVMLEATCQTCNLFEQVALYDTDIETVKAE